MTNRTEHSDDIALFARTAVIELVVTGNWVQEQLTDSLKPYNVSVPQFNVLRILRGQKGTPASLNCINEKMIHKMSNTTRLVDKLIDKNLVERMICEANRRKVEITITQEGLELLKELDKVVTETEMQLIDKLNTDEVAELIGLLKKLKE